MHCLLPEVVAVFALKIKNNCLRKQSLSETIALLK